MVRGSEERATIVGKLLVIHTASAYLIALRGIKRYTTIQKATV